MCPEQTRVTRNRLTCHLSGYTRHKDNMAVGTRVTFETLAFQSGGDSGPSVVGCAASGEATYIHTGVVCRVHLRRH